MENKAQETLTAFINSKYSVTLNDHLMNTLEARIAQLFFESVSHHAKFLVQYIAPKYDGKLLSLYVNAADAERNRRTVGKPAKLLRKIDPTITEKHLEAFSVWFKDQTLANDGLVIKTSKDPQDFADVYKMNQANRSDPSLGHDRKSLAASCMRYEFSHLPQHPCYIYGSGDFTIAWVENSQGKLAARVIVCTRTNKDGLDCFVDGPIYTNSNVAADLLQEWIDQEKPKAKDQDKKTWLNAKLLRIETSDGLLAPYLDRDSSVKDNGEYLRISRHGEIDLCSTHGTVSEYEYHCESCGNGLDEYDAMFTHDQVWCEGCHSDAFSYCETCGEYEVRETMNIIQDTQECVCEYCTPQHYYEVNGSWYSLDGVIFDVYDEPHVSDQEGVTWFMSDVDQEVYPIEDQAPLPLWYPDCMTYDQANDSGHWDLVTKKEIVWVPVKTINFSLAPLNVGQHVTKIVPEYVLKPWLEWNGFEIENNQLDLFESEFFTI